jgi:hypothetical protein
MKEAPENGKESSHSAHANGNEMNGRFAGERNGSKTKRVCRLSLQILPKTFCSFWWRIRRGNTKDGAQLEEALRYKPEGREIDSRWCHWNFSLT